MGFEPGTSSMLLPTNSNKKSDENKLSLKGFEPVTFSLLHENSNYEE